MTLEETLLDYVGDNVGQGCTCGTCERARKVVMDVIVEECGRAFDRGYRLALDQVRMDECTDFDDNDDAEYEIGYNDAVDKCTQRIDHLQATLKGEQ